MPIPINVMVSGDAATPTISWEIPEQEVANRGLNVDYVNILIRDLGTLQDPGTSVAKAVYNVGVVDPATTSFTMPAGALDLNGYYSVQLTLNDTRDGSRRIEQVQSAGTGIFNFVPDVVNQTGGQGVFTPFVDLSGPTTVYHFNGTVVEKEIMFIDPLFAVGYDYAIGVGDPNFASVLLPMVGDNLFELWLWDGLDYVLEDILTAGVEYFFEPAGVDRFRILGIETSAMLDPTNAAAFVTGLTFNASGTFTGTMTPITQFVPAPATLALLLVGLTSIGHRVRKRGFGCVSS
ncbi:MAG: PEP-CTERM sorting domain-containing protein [Chromatiaceae bacterium]|nr:PEP-CTERM sorting domain-containing protein [Chromatiaceae bacterium]